MKGAKCSRRGGRPLQRLSRSGRCHTLIKEQLKGSNLLNKYGRGKRAADDALRKNIY